MKEKENSFSRNSMRKSKEWNRKERNLGDLCSNSSINLETKKIKNWLNLKNLNKKVKLGFREKSMSKGSKSKEKEKKFFPWNLKS